MMKYHPSLCLLNRVGIIDIELSKFGRLARSRKKGTDTMDQFTSYTESVNTILTGNGVINIDTKGGEGQSIVVIANMLPKFNAY